MKRTALTVAVAVAAMAASTTLALAVEAVVTRDSPVYKSRTSNVVVNQVDEDEIVEVVECRSNRCRLVGIPGPDGWVRQNRLAPLDDEGDAQTNVPFRFGITIGPGGPSVSIGVGEGAGSGSSSGPSSGPRVCFFQHVNYGGASFCMSPGQSRSNFAAIGWNDTVSSIRVFAGAGVQVCEHAGFGGACATYNSNQPSLGGFNDLISSAEVF